MSVRALKEIRDDRRQRQSPHLAFETGGCIYPIEFVDAGPAIPGISPEYAEKSFSDIPNGAESVRLKHIPLKEGLIKPIFVGTLKNYGLGPAFETQVTWLPKKIKIGNEQFVIDDNKLLEPRYSVELNTMPPWRQHIASGESSQLTRLPTFIEKDIEKKIIEVTGELKIYCKDVFGRFHVTLQDFYLSTDYLESEPNVHITFMEFKGGA